MRNLVNADCNGWAIYESQYIEGDNPHNIHVVEAFVRMDENGTFFSTPNHELKTQCGNQTLIKGKRACIMASTSHVDIRNKLAALQNGGHEVCGQCAATFYADEEDGE